MEKTFKLFFTLVLASSALHGSRQASSPNTIPGTTIRLLKIDSTGTTPANLDEIQQRTKLLRQAQQQATAAQSTPKPQTDNLPLDLKV